MDDLKKTIKEGVHNAVELGIKIERERVIRYLNSLGYTCTAKHIGNRDHCCDYCPTCNAILNDADKCHGYCPICKNDLPSKPEPDIEHDGESLPLQDMSDLLRVVDEENAVRDGMDMLKEEREAQDDLHSV